jgi:hypothetical protein
MPSEHEDAKQTLSRSAFGTGVGAAVGFVVNGPVGAGVGAILGAGLAAISAPGPAHGELTSERAEVYEKALASDDVKAVLRASEAFDAEGLHVHAELLRRRAKVLQLTPEEKKQREAEFLAAIASDKPAPVRQRSAWFRDQGQLHAAKALAQHAEDVQSLADGRVDAAMVERFERKAELTEAALPLADRARTAFTRSSATSGPAAPSAPETSPA